jgi:hypothetical protein
MLPPGYVGLATACLWLLACLATREFPAPVKIFRPAQKEFRSLKNKLAKVNFGKYFAEKLSIHVKLLPDFSLSNSGRFLLCKVGRFLHTATFRNKFFLLNKVHR